MNLTIADKVAAIVSEVSLASRDRVTQDASLDDLGIESLDRVEIASEIEDMFGIATLDDEALVQIETVGDITRLVEKMVGEK
jgi:acyl carrier protein